MPRQRTHDFQPSAIVRDAQVPRFQRPDQTFVVVPADFVNDERRTFREMLNRFEIASRLSSHRGIIATHPKSGRVANLAPAKTADSTKGCPILSANLTTARSHNRRFVAFTKETHLLQC